MDAKEKFLELKQAWKKADAEERQLIDKEMDVFFSDLSEEQKKQLCEAVEEDFKGMYNELDDIKQTINIRHILAPVLPVLSVSYLAKNYFHKTPQWFYQRMNGSKVNGKPAQFTAKEIEILNFAIQDISKQLSRIAI